MEKLIINLKKQSDNTSFIFTLYCNNISGINWIQKNKFYNKAKYIDIRWHFIRKDIINTKRLRIAWIPGLKQKAEILTKQLTFSGFMVYGKGLELNFKDY